MDFLAAHQLYIVLIIVLGIWLGLYTYLFRLDRRMSRLEERYRNLAEEAKHSP